MIYILNTHETHTMIFGDTGSGKTRTALLPYMLSVINAKESFVVNDCKTEIISETLPYAQKMGYEIVILDYKSPDKSPDRFNPLELAVRYYFAGMKTNAMRLIKSFAMSIVESVSSEKDPYWANSAAAVFMGGSTMAFGKC